MLASTHIRCNMTLYVFWGLLRYMNGQHAIIESYGVLAQLDEQQLLALMSTAALAAGATIIDSNIHSFGEGFGHTGVLLLAESHITVHQWPEDAYTAFDIFMCGDAAIGKAIEVIKNADKAGVHSCQIVRRGEKKPPLLKPDIIAAAVINASPLIIDRLTSVKGLSPGQSREALVEVIKFLSLCALSERTLTPSKIVDDIWHELILFTRTYHDMCYQYFGKFIHHQPSANTGKEHRQFQHTLTLYQNTFGALNEAFWPYQTGSECGACENE